MSIETGARHQWASEEVPYANERQMSTDRDLDECVIKEAASLDRLLFGCGRPEVSGKLCAFASVGGSQPALFVFVLFCFLRAPAAL